MEQEILKVLIGIREVLFLQIFVNTVLGAGIMLTIAKKQ